VVHNARGSHDNTSVHGSPFSPRVSSPLQRKQPSTRQHQIRDEQMRGKRDSRRGVETEEKEEKKRTTRRWIRVGAEGDGPGRWWWRMAWAREELMASTTARTQLSIAIPVAGGRDEHAARWSSHALAPTTTSAAPPSPLLLPHHARALAALRALAGRAARPSPCRAARLPCRAPCWTRRS
jgi:hypothetical protein